MWPTEDLFVYVHVLVDDAISWGGREHRGPARPGSACSDAELLTIALVRHLPGRRGEAGFLAEVACDWAALFPALPHESDANRRIRWLWGAFEHCAACFRAGGQIQPLALLFRRHVAGTPGHRRAVRRRPRVPARRVRPMA